MKLWFLNYFFAGLQICGPHFEMCIAAKCWPCFMQGACPVNFSIRGMCITLFNAFLYADFKQCPVMWIDGL